MPVNDAQAYEDFGRRTQESGLIAARPPAPLDQALLLLEDELASLSAVASEVVERVSPVLGAEREPDGAAAPLAPGGSSLIARRIDEARQRIAGVREHLAIVLRYAEV